MDLYTLMTVLGAAVTVGGALGGWLMRLQGQFHAMDRRIQALELGSEGSTSLLRELREEFRALRAGVEARMDEFEKDLNGMAKDLAVIADRENRRSGAG